MGHRVPLARKFHADFGCNVFMLSYRGYVCVFVKKVNDAKIRYGESEGHASEKGQFLAILVPNRSELTTRYSYRCRGRSMILQ
jgi:hypothetical protein